MKLFNKATVFALGAVLALGAGVAFNRGGEEVKAEEATTYTDVLTPTNLGLSTSGYLTFTNVTLETSSKLVSYNGNAMKATTNNGSGIQIRSTNSNSGIVANATGLKIVKVQLVFTSGKSTSAVDVYGNNTVYTAASNLYSDTTKGTKLGSLSGTNLSLDITSTYTSVGIRSSSDARYIDSITLTWQTYDPNEPSITINSVGELNIGDSGTFTATTKNAGEAAVNWTSSNSEVVSITSSGAYSVLKDGTTDITATVTVNEVDYKDTLTVIVPKTYRKAIIPKDGLTYKFGFVNSKSETLYFNGKMSGHYAASTSDITLAADLTITKEADGYLLSVGANYVAPVASGEYVNFKYSSSKVYASFDLVYKTFKFDVSGTTYFLGSAGTYGTGSAYTWDKIADSFPLILFEDASIAVATDEEVVDFFVSTYMHTEIATTEEGTGLCKTKGWYTDAKTAYSALSDTQKSLFNTNEKYAAMKARLAAWAVANGEELASDGTLKSNMINVEGSSSNALIITLSMVGVSLVAGAALFLLRKKKFAK